MCNPDFQPRSSHITQHITQHVHSATHLHGHTLDLILTFDSSLVSNVVVSDYISDHAMIKCQVETPITANSEANTVTYRRYHKINIDTLRNDLSNCSFVACPGDTAKKLYDQYTDDLFQPAGQTCSRGYSLSFQGASKVAIRYLQKCQIHPTTVRTHLA